MWRQTAENQKNPRLELSLKSTAHTRVDPSSEDPGPCGDCSFNEALPHHLLETRVELKVLNSSVDRDKDLRQLHVPLLQHQPKDALRPRVVGQTHILQFSQTEESLDHHIDTKSRKKLP